MMKKPDSSLALAFLLLLFLPHADATLGVCIGKAAASLAAPAAIAQILVANGIQMVRFLEANPELLAALKNTGIKVMVGVANSDVVPIAVGGAEAAITWLNDNVLKHVASHQLSYIAVGDEVLDVSVKAIPYVVPAMNNLHRALQQLGLDSAVKISSPVPASVLAISMPPSAGDFSPISRPLMEQMLRFLSATQSTMMVNIYPIEQLMKTAVGAAMNFFLMQGNAAPVKDGRHSYTNIMDATVDAMVTAMRKAGYPAVPVTVTSTGWPAAGKNNAATPDNAEAFLEGIIKRALNGTGTPMRPDMEMEVFVSSLFNGAGNGGEGQDMGIFNTNGSVAVNFSLHLHGELDAASAGKTAGKLSPSPGPSPAALN
ncbi:hypothetical protein Cni_G12574 [Canna indica]|uniref:Glucan endo-1,3-beta-D-glucosidase n=1 Tax=Canna indica TaxID=4628 RepID=A0AAQ3QAQ1_9LILI|nr:hypothetical protein Cni_G12574 [Canna indica]